MDMQDKNTFIHALVGGINIIAGSAFSLLAEDTQGKTLPLGNIVD